MREIEALLALVFGDVGALANPGLFRDSNVRNLMDVDVSALTDAVVDRFPDWNSPSLQMAVQDAVARADGDPLTLLRNALQDDSIASTTLRWRRFPLFMFEPSSRGIKRTVPFAVADSHLHTGAVLPAHMLLRGICQRAARLSRHELRGSRHLTATGLVVDPILLFAGTRFVLRLLWHCYARQDPRDPEGREAAGLDAVWTELALTGEFWRELATLDVEADAIVFSSLAREMPYLGRCPPLQDLVWSPAVASTMDDEPRRLLLIGLIRACAFIVQQVSSRAGEGLARFVDRFDAMGLYRDTALDKAKEESIFWALDLMTRNAELLGAEFRKTVIAKDRKEFADIVVRALGVHNAGFARFGRDIDGTPRALTMPVGWRRIPLGSNDDPRPYRLQELRAVVEGVGGLDRVLRSLKGSADAIFSTDVAGDEVGSQNWPYVIGAQLLKEVGAELIFTIHAGESFATPLNGVRRIGELLLSAVPPRRIGHALALSESAAAIVSSRWSASRLSRSDAVMDLCWALNVGLMDQRPFVQLLQRLLRPTGRGAPTAYHWADAFPTLFDLTAMRERGVVVSTGGLLGVASPDELERLAKSYVAPSDRAFAGLCLAAPESVTVCELDAPLTEDEIEAYLRVTAAAVAEARAYVKQALKDGDIVVEACPTSNIITSGLPGYAEHPLWGWIRDDELLVTISSDDPLVFGSLVADEYASLRAVGDVRFLEIAAATSTRTCSGGRARRLDSFEEIVRRCS